MDRDITPLAVIAFWKEAGPARWYKKDSAFDAEFKARFAAVHAAAARRELDDWIDTPDGSLALMLLLDQYPRNSFRGTAQAFATDPLARQLASEAIRRGHDRAFEPELRQFFLMPLMHSEDLGDQNRLLSLCVSMPATERYAHVHRDIIVRFGRFPHRNDVLGRVTTAEEAEFLHSGGFAG